jgi:Sec-independent protein translocase protein TatA
MAGIDMEKVILFALVVLVVVFIAYQYNPYMFSSLRFLEGFADAAKKEEKKEEKKEKFEDKKEKEKPKDVKKFQNEKFEDKKEKFEDKKKEGFEEKKEKFENGEGFADLSAYEGPAQFGSAEQPAGCYPRDQLTPSELLPKDNASVWSEQNPMGPGSLKGKNFLSAGALIGVNTVGQSMRNANLQVRSEPPCPQVAVSIFNQSTISPDVSHRPLEIGA